MDHSKPDMVNFGKLHCSINYYKHEDGRIVKYPTSLDEEDMSSEGIIDNMMIYPITKEDGNSLNQVNPLLHRLKGRLENYSNYLLFFIIPQTTDLNNTINATNSHHSVREQL